MDLGTFSVSLTVKDVEVSQSFYEKLGFEVIDGGHQNTGFPDTDSMKWRIMSNDAAKLGLFQGMFDHNILTFNPSDVLSVQHKLKNEGVVFTKEADASSGMTSAFLKDPDGNPIMFDQL